MLLTDEQYVIKWLSQYGPLPRAQVVRLLRHKTPSTAERIAFNISVFWASSPAKISG